MLARRLTETPYKLGDRGEDALIDLFLRLTRGFQLGLRHKQRMIAAFDDMKKVRRFHFLANVLEEIERAEWVARSLHEQDRRSQVAQHFVAKLVRISGAAEWIAEANQAGHRFLERNMATDPATHALPDQDHWLPFIFSGIA